MEAIRVAAASHRDGPSSTRSLLERGVTHDVQLRAVGEQGLGLQERPSGDRRKEVSLADFRKDIIIEVYNEAGQKAIAYHVYPMLGLRVPGATGSRRQRQCGRDPALKLENEGWDRDPSVLEPTEPSF